MVEAKRIAGFILSALAWCFGAVVCIGGAIYAIGMVMWFHAPFLMVMAFTIPVAAILVGFAWALNRIGRKLRAQ